ncbi:RNA polymerase-binding transcription factor DksA [compost metagenome]
MTAIADPRTVLDALAAEYTQRAEAIRRNLLSPHSSSFPEQAVERQNDDVLRSLLAEAEHGLQEVAHARARLAEGRYGICTACGATIAPARLAALPAAELCVDCAAHS